MATKSGRPYRLLLVTFDLFNTKSGDARYARADAALRSKGRLFRPVKQIRLLITRSTSQRVKASLDQQLGKDSTVIVVPITSLPAWRVHTRTKRKEWSDLIQALDDHGVDVRYAAATAEGGA